jgi:hypothetical protein
METVRLVVDSKRLTSSAPFHADRRTRNNPITIGAKHMPSRQILEYPCY